LKPVECENRLLSSICDEDDLRHCQQEGVTRETFVLPEGKEVDHGDVWEYLIEHSKEHSGELPSDKDLESLFGFKATEPGDLKSYVRLARQQQVGREATMLFNEYIPKLVGAKDPESIVQELSKQLAALKAETGGIIDYIDADALKRLEDFDEAKEAVKTGKMIGIPTGLSTFDDQYLGFRPGELVVVIGGTGVGKSWLLLYMAAVAHKNGKKIFIVSPELSLLEQGMRFDPIRAHLEKIRLSNQELLTGQGSRKEYKTWLTDLAKQKRFAGIERSDTGRALTFDDVWRFTLETKPDMVIIDGVYLLTGMGDSKKGWEILKEGMDNLKALAQQEGIVILCAHQPTRDASMKSAMTTPPGLAQIGYGFSVAQSANRVISMSYSSGHKQELYRLYRVVKLRGGRPIVDARKLRFNVDVGEIHEVPYDPENPGEEETSNDFQKR
jgi:KaiC/GvpD/RAD55 family RecA-like ATPase